MNFSVLSRSGDRQPGQNSSMPQLNAPFVLRKFRLMLEGAVCGVAFMGIVSRSLFESKYDFDLIGAGIGATAVGIALVLRQWNKI